VTQVIESVVRNHREERPAFSLREAKVLAAELRARIQGEVRFDDGDRALYATDSSNYRQVPIGVVLPRTVEDVVETVRLCRQRGAPLLSRGGGTSLAGQCCNAAVVLDMSKYLNQIMELDPARRLAWVQPGLVLDELRDRAEEHHLTFGPDPATHNRCTLGGMIGNNSCGAHSIMAGRTAENVEALEILTYDGLRMRVGPTSEGELASIISAGGRRGEIYAALKTLRDRYADLVRARFPDIPRRVSGYNLDELLPEKGFHVARALVGTESTCVTVLEATVRLVESPPGRALLVLGYPDVPTGCDHVPEILAHHPLALEGFDDLLTRYMRLKGMRTEYLPLLPEGGGWLMVEFGGAETAEAVARAHALMAQLRAQRHPPSMHLFESKEDAHKIWLIRESGLGGTAHVPNKPMTWPGWEDSAVPPERMGDYLRDLRHLLDEFGYEAAYYGHFGQGCLHTRIPFDLTTTDGISHMLAFVDRAADLVVRYGGSLSGEHGDGQARGQLLPKMYGDDLVQAFREFKGIWDPNNKMNPGKVVDAYRIQQNLRLGADYDPRQVSTHFQFPEDSGSFASAALRCVGVGLCRRHGEGTMCPSYMVTREEEHSTRGRAHLLFEMMRGTTLADGWRDKDVREALDLCLACKGCKTECPVNVDMATYKAEFLSHYYARRLRPRAAYMMGLIYWWARAASKAPGLVNRLAHAPVLSGIGKRLGGIAPERQIPAFAPQPFTAWFKARGVRNVGQPQIVLWPDTFNNYFHPSTAIAAVEVLEDAGFQVIIPECSLCCGRPLYDFGLLDTAERLLKQILQSLRPQIEAGIPVVGLEPSCVSVFRDELVNLFPHDVDALHLKQQTFLLSEFLNQRIERYEPPTLARKALVHGHCHHKTVLGMRDEQALLKKMGLEVEQPESGCCGMAGAFGFEHNKYDVSIKAGERVLLPAVRAASKDTLIVSDGFSCREQIAQGTDRTALHLAQVLQMALREGPHGPLGGYPETQYVENPLPQLSRRRVAVLAGVGAALAGGAALAWASRRPRGARPSIVVRGR
jgi:FAD/FMN-containing dehydrogenase/Fe-S oxidoreductase